MAPDPNELGPVGSDTMQYGGQQNTQTEDRTAERGGEGPNLPTALAWVAAIGAGAAFGFNSGPLGLMAASMAVQNLGRGEDVNDVPDERL